MIPITDFTDYFITREGEVISTKFGKERPLKQVVCSGTGYKLVTLVKVGNIRKNKRIHRLMMEAYVPNPQGKAHVNHIDGNKLNNSLSNLEWSTCAENSQHAMDTGLSEAVLKVTRKPIEMYAKDKVTLIKVFDSLHDAHRETGTAVQNIGKVAMGKRHTAGGYHWKYKNV